MTAASCLVAAFIPILSPIWSPSAPPDATPVAVDSATVATVSAALSHAAHGKLDTPSCRVYLKSPRATSEGITYESLEDPVPTDALHLPSPVPWADVQALEARSPARIPFAVALGVAGAVVGHMLWTGSSRSVMIDGHPVYAKDRQAYYIVGGVGVGMAVGLALNLWSSRVRAVYPVLGK